ncbi:MAG: M17 family peptidase N-terminal domain-containing protein, partial [Planctomycetota bacterium]
MQISFISGTMQEMEADALVLFTPEITKPAGRELQVLNKASNGAVATLIDSGEFTGKAGESSTLYHVDGYIARRIILAGLGASGKITPDSFRKAMGNISRNKGMTSAGSAVVYFHAFNDDKNYQAAMEGYLLGSYKLTEFKSEEKNSPLTVEKLIFAVPKQAAVPKLKKAVIRGQIIGEGQILVRQLSFTPANYLTPSMYADKVSK